MAAESRPPHRGLYSRVLKRAFDIGLGVIGLPIIGLHFVFCAPLIRREDGGPVFYNATRVGRDGRPFTMYKYRTMHVAAPDIKDADGSTYNAPDDPRQTRIGAFLRRTSMDEFPQVINVLKGDMSFIGPRPDLPEETELYQGDEPLKLRVRPGISGYAQVFGRNSIPFHDRLALDVRYVRHQSFLLDLRIFLRTFTAVFKQHGIYESDASDVEQ
jgi:lipopolysaccharide/colanic/teichoic acid biosynthesis glycosyltransferase